MVQRVRTRFQCSYMPPILMFTSLHAIGGNFACFFLSSLYFLKETFSNKTNQSLTNCLDPDQPGC